MVRAHVGPQLKKEKHFIKITCSKPIFMIDFTLNELPRGRAIEVSSGKNFIFSLMKTSGFQTFLFDHRGRASGNSFD